MTSESDRNTLLEIARQAIIAGVSAPKVSYLPEPALARNAGAFVTLHKNGVLRGCIGHVEPNERLVDVVARCAVGAATTDPRFPTVVPSEVPELEIEISILGPLEQVTSLEDIEIGRHGLVVEKGWARGLLLPQVATERNWTPSTFVAETCHKAGLPPDAWTKGATVWKFEAEVFSEGEGR